MRVPLLCRRRTVSIHASAREATLASARRGPSGRCSFNPRLRAGGDYFSVRDLCLDASFNPRLRAGGDGASVRCRQWRRCFNPRLRAGGDFNA